MHMLHGSYLNIDISYLSFRFRNLHSELRAKLKENDWVVDGLIKGNMYDFYLKVIKTISQMIFF